MSTPHDPVIADEQAADSRYRIALQRAQRNRPPVPRRRGGPVDRRRPPANPTPPINGLVGRVALAEEVDYVGGAEFYIGSHHIDEAGLLVFSWVAPIARTFFTEAGHHELCSNVTATRTLLRRGGQIVGYADDRGPAASSHIPFEARGLKIPKAPTQRLRPSPTASVRQRRGSASKAISQRQDGGATLAIPTQPPGPSVLRAKHAVLQSIVAPRQDRLSNVLATLQADQYQIVTTNPSEPLVVQGHPGTGKTVVATHRAAYLVHSEAAEHRCRHVLVVGPTTHYVEHVQGVLAELVAEPGAVGVMSLADILLSLRGLEGQIDDGLPVTFEDVDQELNELVARTVQLLRATSQLGQSRPYADRIRAVYAGLRANLVGAQRITEAQPWVEYLTRLPMYSRARSMRRYLPLLAACGLHLQGKPAQRYDHIIVDEAQDVTPLEWTLLKSFNTQNSWSLFGDLNQRRSDSSWPSWQQIGDTLDLGLLTTEKLQRGYRTAASIMEFAGRLLPAEVDARHSLQSSGNPPRLLHVPDLAALHPRAAHEASLLLTRHPHGTVAVISLNPAETTRAMRQAGYTVDSRHPNRLNRGGRMVRVLHPQDARGLEFDATIVIEPCAFPKRHERHGLLYTTLTRANLELVVLYSSALPEELRAPRPQQPSGANLTTAPVGDSPGPEPHPRADEPRRSKLWPPRNWHLLRRKRRQSTAATQDQ